MIFPSSFPDGDPYDNGSFTSLLLEEFKKKTEELANSIGLPDFGPGLFNSSRTRLEELKGQMSEINDTIYKKISKNAKLRASCPQSRELLTEELDWSTPLPLQLNSKFRTLEIPSIYYRILNLYYSENKDKFLKNPIERKRWKKARTLVEIRDNLRKIGFLIEGWINIGLLDIMDDFNNIQSHGLKLATAMEEILDFYNVEINPSPSRKLRNSLVKCETSIRELKKKIFIKKKGFLELYTKAEDLQLLTSRTSVLDILQIAFPDNPTLESQFLESQFLEYEKTVGCLDQFEKMSEVDHELDAWVWDVIARILSIKYEIWEAHAQIKSLPD